jgi:hypothetical protein
LTVFNKNDDLLLSGVHRAATSGGIIDLDEQMPLPFVSCLSLLLFSFPSSPTPLD